MKKPKLLGFLLLLCAAAGAQNKALTFNGVDSYVDLGTSIDANHVRSMECWVKFNDLTKAQEIISKSIISQGVELLLYNNTLSVYCMNGSDYSFISYPATNLQTNVWYHVAFTWNGTRESMRLYVNGKPVGNRIDGGNIDGVGVSNPGRLLIGDWSEPIERRLLDATVDEVRIWNTTCSANEIKAGMYGTVPAGTAGLLAYYKLNDGAGTTVVNNSASADAAPATGTLINNPTWSLSPVQQGNNSLNFDGVDDYVAIPPNPLYDFTYGTVECWVKLNDLTNKGNVTILSNRSTDATRYSFHISTIGVGLYNGNTYQAVEHEILNSEQWHHLAFVCTPTETRVFVDGLDMGITGNTISSQAGLPLQIGIAHNGIAFEPFYGAIDEVRIWNVARTQAEIQADMNKALTGTETGLVGLFGFNQGVANGDNSGLITVVDGTANNNHGTLRNFAVSSAASNWVGSAVTPLPVTLLAFTAFKKPATVQLNWSTGMESNSDRFEIERSVDGRQYTTIGSVRAAGTSSVKRNYNFEDKQPVVGTSYYRLKQVDRDGKTTLSKVVTIRWHQEKPVVLTVTPQPVQLRIHIRLGGVDTDGVLILLDSKGHTVKNYPVKAGTTQLEIERSGLPVGIYFYRLATVSGVIKASGKLVAE